jgi:small-conductance mechanosensitive channel
MALSIDTSPVLEFVQHLVEGASVQLWAWQLGVALAAIGLAWCVARATFRWVRPSPRWKFGEGDFERVAYPALAWVFVVIGRAVLSRHQPVALLDILATALVAWIVIRLAVYVLGYVLPQGDFLRKLIRAVAWVAWIAVILQVTGLLPEVVQTLDDVSFTSSKSRQRYSLWLMLQGLVALAVALTVAFWVARITEGRVMAEQSVDMSTRVVVSKLVRIAAVFIAVLVALPMVGIDITALSIFGGALGVGLGFGLQKIAANYVSGFIVLLDRSLRIGDTITIGDRRGEVREIASRYTVIKGGDGVESIVPNEKLITEVVNHHTYSDPRVTVSMAVAVAYDADVDRAIELLVQIARRDPRVTAEPAPTARVKSLGDFGVHLELTAWMDDLAQGESDLRSALYRDLLRTFRAEGIEVAYRRREMQRENPPSATAETRESDE